MRKILFAVAVIGVFVAGVFALRKNEDAPPEAIIQPPEENNPLPAAPPPEATSTKPSVPQGFQGPTGQPKIIGPSGPPPNY